MEKPGDIDRLDIEILSKHLERFGVDTSTWGLGKAKTVEHLLDEINNQESNLFINDSGELIRKIEVACSFVFYKSDDGRLFRLKEDRQVFNGGRERRRDSSGQAVFEKMKSDENPTEAIIRGMREELGVDGVIDVTELGQDDQLRGSNSYPGLVTMCTFHVFETTLNDGQFKPDGYVEVQKDKSTYFVWEIV
jgi:hypothetical protein